MNNMNSNKPTVVERYIVTETAELIHDPEALARWNDACKALGLEGQQKLVIPDKSPIPFLWMNKGLENVFTTLCPQKIDVTKFDKSPIPLEALDLAALASREGYFGKIQVWYDDVNPDPVLVGITCDFVPVSKGYNWHHSDLQPTREAAIKWLADNGLEPYSPPTYTTNEKFYLMARWGDVAKPFEQLRAEAITRYIDTTKADAEQRIRDAQRTIEDLESESRKRFN